MPKNTPKNGNPPQENLTGVRQENLDQSQTSRGAEKLPVDGPEVLPGIHVAEDAPEPVSDAPRAAQGHSGQAPDSEVSGNPAAVAWPTDRQGVTSALKRALIGSGNRINGQSYKLDLVLETLKIGEAHIRARYENQVRLNTDQDESYKWRQKVQEKAAKKDAEKRVQVLMDEIDRIKGEM